ncbi:transposase [Actinomycetospora sp. NBRC 106375]|uniref:transposase n=1 Tax=Actinomycetospora sp. NBRC 106375 TaxID=3032207 RepID=UPI0033280865
MIDTLMPDEEDALRGAAHSERSEARAHQRNGYALATSAPAPARWTWRSEKLRQGSYFPDWLLERRRRVEAADLGGGHLLGPATHGGWSGSTCSPSRSCCRSAVDCARPGAGADLGDRAGRVHHRFAGCLAGGPGGPRSWSAGAPPGAPRRCSCRSPWR